MLDISVVIPTYNRLETLQHVIPSLLVAEHRAGALRSDRRGFEFDRRNARSIWRPKRAFVIFRASTQVAPVRATRGSRLQPDGSSSSTTAISSRHVICSNGISRVTKVERCAVVGLEVQVRSYDEFLAKSAALPSRDSLHPPNRKRLSWLYFLTGNASVAKRDLDAVGSFDESFTGYGHEDLELGYRLETSGVRIVYEPKAVNYHLQDVGFEDQKSKMELAGRSTVRFYRKHPAFVVKLRLGMTPLSLGVHSLLERTPADSGLAGPAVRNLAPGSNDCLPISLRLRDQSCTQ